MYLLHMLHLLTSSLPRGIPHTEHVSIFTFYTTHLFSPPSTPATMMIFSFINVTQKEILYMLCIYKSPSAIRTRKDGVRWLLALVGHSRSSELLYTVVDVVIYQLLLKKRIEFKDIKSDVDRLFLSKGRKPPSDEAVRYHLRKMVRCGILSKDGVYYKFSGGSLERTIERLIDDLLSRKEELTSIAKEVEKIYMM